MEDRVLMCTICGDVLTYDEVAYDGPLNPDDTGCSPFMPWKTICTKCDEVYNGGER